MAGAGSVRAGKRLVARLRGLLDEAPEDSVDLVGYHYGRAPALPTLKGAKYGAGSPGREAERVGYATDPRIKKRVYFYGGREDGLLPAPEPVVLGDHIYRADLGGLYQPGKSDPAVARAARSEGQFDANAFEGGLLDAGYSGYFTPESNQAVMLGFDEVPADYLGPRFDLRDRIWKRK
jgi:hypothetical protein